MHAIFEYLRVELPTLRERYHWSIPHIDGFPLSGETTYDANVALKKFLHERWLSKTTNDQRLELAEFVIAAWGGVRGNRPTTLQRFVAEIGKENPATPLHGVASYSKLYSIAQPDRYSIYDARVAACLNAIQYQFDPHSGLAFNYCPGRNNQIGNVATRTGFVFEEEFRVRTLVGNGWNRIPRANTYGSYLLLLRNCAVEFPKYKRHDFEMLLFANAEIETRKAMAKAREARRH